MTGWAGFAPSGIAIAGAAAAAAVALAPGAVADGSDGGPGTDPADSWPYAHIVNPFAGFYEGPRSDVQGFPPWSPVFVTMDQTYQAGPDEAPLFSVHSSSLTLWPAGIYHYEVFASELDAPPVGTIVDQSHWFPYMDLTKSWVVPQFLFEAYTIDDPVHGTHSLLEGFGGWLTNEYVSDASGTTDVLTLAADGDNPIEFTLFDIPASAAADSTDSLDGLFE